MRDSVVPARRLDESTRAQNALLITWIATIAADRIDLLGGSGGFLFTPFLALTPTVAASEVLRRRLRGNPIILSTSASAYMLLISVFLAIVGASVVVSPDFSTSVSRAALLGVQVAGTIAVLLAAWDRRGLAAIFDTGAVIGILLYLICDCLQATSLLGVIPKMLHAGPISVDVYPSMYGSILPRLSGVVADQNRAGIVLLFYGWIISTRATHRPKVGWLFLVAILMLATLSRSVMVGALVTLGATVLDRRIRAIPVRFVYVTTLCACAALAVLTVSATARESVSVGVQPFIDRLSFAEGSSQVHFRVLERGWDVGTASISRVALGLGYGSGYTVLQDVFPGNRYGNFHSLFITMMAECGIFALICSLLLFAVPLFGGGPWRAVIAGACAFNVFYQAFNEPALWIILTVAWLTIPVVRHARFPVGQGAALRPVST